MKKRQQVISWAEYLERNGDVPDMTVIRDMPDFSKSAFFIQKRQAMKEWIDRYGLGEDAQAGRSVKTFRSKGKV